MSSFPTVHEAFKALTELCESFVTLKKYATESEVNTILVATQTLMNQTDDLDFIIQSVSGNCDLWAAENDDEFLSRLFQHLQYLENTHGTSLKAIVAILTACVIVLRPRANAVQENSRQQIDENVIALVRPETTSFTEEEPHAS